jgi:hypothetical protein
MPDRRVYNSFRRDSAFSLERFVIENVDPGKTLWRREALLRNAREIGAGGLCPPLATISSATCYRVEFSGGRS